MRLLCHLIKQNIPKLMIFFAFGRPLPIRIILNMLVYLQGRIFTFGALVYFKLGVLLEGLRRLMSYKLALHVLVTFTEQVVPIQKHITLF